MALSQRAASPVVEEVSEVEEVVDETFGSAEPVEDFEDDEDYGDAPGPSPQPVANGNVTRTSNFFGHNEEGSQVHDRGIEVVEAQPNTNVVRVNEDVGPIFLGRRRQLALKKGVAYKVDSDIYDYLSSRGLIYGE